ncbi:MAG: helix-turn-helix domain-containing protein [Clostridium sp.]|nr:helix-turn-helix domain-containing protein [Acetatifactor muris]MCM1525898.1 helix-turn-helix domain-containing protein [Bacteroides sp.]MCM1562563.1 helix-turn-helix domain-containing protein [Clostridium sp.]
MDSRKFGEFIAAVRKEKGWTQAELAEKLNVTDKAVSRWERGLGFPDINTVKPLADALEVSVSEIMQSEKDVKEEQDGRINRMNRYKNAFPIIIYAGSLVLHTISAGDLMLRTLSILPVLICGVCMGINVWNLPLSQRKQCAAAELLFCVISFLTSCLSGFMGNILSSICIIFVTCVYVCFVSPKLLQRKIL